MSNIMILCPKTGQEVWTGVQTDAHSFEFLTNTPYQMTCPACGETHEWSRREAFLAGFEKTLPPQKR